MEEYGETLGEGFNVGWYGGKTGFSAGVICLVCASVCLYSFIVFVNHS